MLFVDCHSFCFTFVATSQIQFISKFSGQTVIGLVNSSFNFSWSFSGDVTQISWGVWDTRKGTFVTDLVRVTQSVTVQVQSSSAYYGRVDGSRRDSSINTQVISPFFLSQKKMKQSMAVCCTPEILIQ